MVASNFTNSVLAHAWRAFRRA